MANGQVIDDHALVVTEPIGGDYLPDVTDIDRAVGVYDKIRLEAVKRLKKGTDFGTIPGTSKDTLLKPGAEKLCNFFGLSVESETVDSEVDWDKGYAFFRVKTILRSKKNGQVIATGIGSCNSREKKYRHLSEDGGLADLLNTIEKMAQKRSHVDATLRGTGLSDIYTQDVEDLPSEVVIHHNTPHAHSTPATQGDHNSADVLGFGKHKDKAWADVPGDYLEWLSTQIDKKTGEPSPNSLRAKAELARRGATEGGKAANDEELQDLVAKLDYYFDKADSGSKTFWESFKVESADQVTTDLCKRWLRYFESDEAEMVDLDTFMSTQMEALGLA